MITRGNVLVDPIEGPRSSNEPVGDEALVEVLVEDGALVDVAAAGMLFAHCIVPCTVAPCISSTLLLFKCGCSSKPASGLDSSLPLSLLLLNPNRRALEEAEAEPAATVLLLLFVASRGWFAA